MQLKIINDKKVDHPRNGSKDLADAVAGAVYNAAANTKRVDNEEIEVYDASSRAKVDTVDPIVYPDVPEDIANWLSGVSII